MSVSVLICLFLAGLLGGAINTLAGGGSFVIYPALIWAGLPPITANITNTFACTPGYFSGAFSLRREIIHDKKRLVVIGLVSIIGGTMGAITLISVDNTDFEIMVPWLLLIASLLFIYGERLRRWLQNTKAPAKTMRLSIFAVLTLPVCFYGGFFNAGLGILLLALGAVAGLRTIHENNAFKLYISGMASLFAILIFLVSGSVDFVAGSVTLLGTLIGGYFAGIISGIIPANRLKGLIALFSLGVTLTFFIIVYA